MKYYADPKHWIPLLILTEMPDIRYGTYDFTSGYLVQP